MKNAIVMGGSGFVGRALVRELLSNNVEVTVISRSRERLTELSNINIIECSLGDIEKLPDLIKDRGFDVFYQLAWNGLSGDALTDYKTQIMNIKWIMDSIRIAAELDCKRFVGAGSISQYELSVQEGQISQFDKHKVYKTAKLACEYMGRSVAEANGILFFWPIITNIYGAGENSPRLINTMIRNLLDGRRQSLSDGNQYYDFIYITDAAKAFHLIGEKGVVNRNYVLAGGNTKPLKEYLCALRDIVASEAELGFGELAFNGIYIPKDFFDITPLTEDTGFRPQTSFSQGVRYTMEWIKTTTAKELLNEKI